MTTRRKRKQMRKAARLAELKRLVDPREMKKAEADRIHGEWKATRADVDETDDDRMNKKTTPRRRVEK